MWLFETPSFQVSHIIWQAPNFFKPVTIFNRKVRQTYFIFEVAFSTNGIEPVTGSVTRFYQGWCDGNLNVTTWSQTFSY